MYLDLEFPHNRILQFSAHDLLCFYAMSRRATHYRSVHIQYNMYNYYIILSGNVLSHSTSAAAKAAHSQHRVKMNPLMEL